MKHKLEESWNAIEDMDAATAESLIAMFDETYEHVKGLVQTSVILPFLNECRDEISKSVK